MPDPKEPTEDGPPAEEPVPDEIAPPPEEEPLDLTKSPPEKKRATAPRPEGPPAEELAPDKVVASPEEEEPLDLTKSPAKEDRVDLREAPPYSPEQAKIIWPIAKILLLLIAAVMLLPFLIIVTVEKEKVGRALDWAKTVLPPVVGFGGALVGYYFGTRGSQQASPSDEEGEVQ